VRSECARPAGGGRACFSNATSSSPRSRPSVPCGVANTAGQALCETTSCARDTPPSPSPASSRRRSPWWRAPATRPAVSRRARVSWTPGRARCGASEANPCARLRPSRACVVCPRPLCASISTNLVPNRWFSSVLLPLLCGPMMATTCSARREGADKRETEALRARANAQLRAACALRCAARLVAQAPGCQSRLSDEAVQLGRHLARAGHQLALRGSRHGGRTPQGKTREARRAMIEFHSADRAFFAGMANMGSVTIISLL